MKFLAPIPALIAIISGIVLVCIGAILISIIPSVIKSTISKQMALNPTSENLETFLEPSLPVFRKVYFFNYTNAEELMEEWMQVGAKPKVQEVGPYTYRVSQKKVEVEWLTGDRVQYRTVKSFEFQPEMSKGTEDDIVFSPNSPISAMVNMAPEDQLSDLSNIFYMTMPTLFVERTISELLFEGYIDETVVVMSDLAGEEILPGNRFGFFLGSNNTAGSMNTIYRGNEDPDKLSYIAQWNYSSTLTTWRGKCNDMIGYLGPFPPGITNRGQIPLFTAEFCRTLHIDYEEDTVTHDIPTKRFVMDISNFGDYNCYPENECYCNPEMGDCPSTGVFSLEKCMQGVPVFASFPHFLQADHKYFEAIDGLKPNKSKHQTVMELEPTTSLPIKASTRMQTNVKWKNHPEIPIFEDVPEILMPLFWMEEDMELTEELLDKTSGSLNTLKSIGAIPIVLFVIGGIIGGIGLICSIIIMFKKNKVQPNEATMPAKVLQIQPIMQPKMNNFVPVYH